MLLQFIVGNYLSFNEEVVLDLTPAKSRIHQDHVIVDENGKRVQAVPLIALYGANASGKSNLIKAMEFSRQLIVDGTKASQNIQAIPFKLDQETTSKPSRFEYVFKHQGVLYTYGFAVTTSKVVEEWLFAVLNRNEVRLFERVTTEDNQVRVEFGRQLAPSASQRNLLKFISQSTRPNQLFLTEANERNVKELKPVWGWFNKQVQLLPSDFVYSNIALRASEDKQFFNFLKNTLLKADTGINSFSLKKEVLNLDKHFPDISQDHKEKIANDLENDYVKLIAIVNTKKGLFNIISKNNSVDNMPILTRMKTLHTGRQDDLIEFELAEESEGTRRLIHCASAVLDMIENEKLFVVDELERSLHPALSRFLLNLFLHGSIAKQSKGQLIFSTHESSLLNLDLFRRDEIWFVEKDRAGASNLTSLAEYKVRNDLQLEKGYLTGRFGAIPFLGDPQSLFREDEIESDIAS